MSDWEEAQEPQERLCIPTGLGMPQVPLHKAWSTRMGKMMPELLLLVCCQWSQNPDMLIDTCKGRCRWKSENASRILSFVKLWLSYGKQQ